MGIPKIAPPFWLHISWTSFEFVEISAGGQRWPATLANWWNCNAVELQSFSSSEIITALKRLKSELTCPLFFNPLPPNFLAIDDFVDSAPAGTDFADFADAILIAAERLFSSVASSSSEMPSSGRQHRTAPPDSKRGQSTFKPQIQQI